MYPYSQIRNAVSLRKIRIQGENIGKGMGVVREKVKTKRRRRRTKLTE